MKVLLIGAGKIAHLPFANFYLEALSKVDAEVHLLYWNRDGGPEFELPYDVTLHEFRATQRDEVPKISKIPNYLKYRSYAHRLIREGDFSLLIPLHTMPALTLYSLLTGKYARRFIFDYRDVTMERIPPFRAAIGQIVKHSIVTFVSSEAFRAFLPAGNEVMSTHNILLDSLHERDRRRAAPRSHWPIRIRFWGFVRHESVNRALIDALANDARFELHYHGRQQAVAARLQQHVRQNAIHNVHFHGPYSPTDRYDFASETEIIHNLYDNDHAMTYATSNKFYDGIALYLPQLCSTHSHMGDLVERLKVGLACTPFDPQFADSLIAYYSSIDWVDFEQSCDEALERVVLEYTNGLDAVATIAAGIATR
jgi:hypothetical protein